MIEYNLKMKFSSQIKLCYFQYISISVKLINDLNFVLF